MNIFKSLNTYQAEDMSLHYFIDDTGVPALSILPIQLEGQISKRRQFINHDQGVNPLHMVFQQDFPACKQSNLIQLKIIGDAHPGAFAGGTTMTNSPSSANLRFVSQKRDAFDGGFTIVTRLEDERGLKARHHLTSWHDQPFLEVFTTIENTSPNPISIEMISSFCLGGLSPFQSDHGSEKYNIHRFSSTWSAEGRHECKPIEELNLEKSWSSHGTRSLRFGQVGSMPVKGYFPFVALEDSEFETLWGAQIATPGSWQLEVFRNSDTINICGGLADRETGHWLKTLRPGTSFTSPKAILSCCSGDIQDLTNRMVRYQQRNDEDLPKSEHSLPVIFNDWCTTWGHPSEDNITSLANKIEGIGIDYLVLDDGWFNDKPGCQQGLGDWNVSKTIYPNGFKRLHTSLRNKEFVSGVWFELENCTQGSEIYEQTEHLLHRDGHVLQSGERRFLDFRDPWVHDYLEKKVIKMLKQNEITYIKTDYNDTIGIGCDGAESLGEGLREHLEEVQKFYRHMRDEIPELKIEICASGGHRLEPSWMELGSMGGFSDSHEGLDIPIIAANTQMMIPARKNQVWAVLRKEDTQQRLYYSIAATFLGRMCLSGDIHELSSSQMKVVEKGIDTYHRIKESIKNGYSRKEGSKLSSYTSPKGWQTVTRFRDDLKEAFVVFHTFENGPTSLTVPNLSDWKIAETYYNHSIQAQLKGSYLVIQSLRDFDGGVIKLNR